MSRLSDLFGGDKSEPARPKGQAISGNYQCNHCESYALVAEYYPNEELAVWFCGNGHKNYAEKFRIQ